jgi:hypothetical protein
MMMRFLLACFLCVHVASLTNTDHPRVARVEVEVDAHGVNQGKAKRARKESTIAKTSDRDAIARTEKLTSEELNCSAGQIAASSEILAVELPTQNACNARCVATNGCVAFDFTSDRGSPPRQDTCRLASALGRYVDPSGRNRQYCVVKGQQVQKQNVQQALPPKVQKQNVAQSFTAADLQSMTVQNDPNSCYIGLFDGTDANAPGGVYLISPAWYANHPGGTFAGQPWCGTPRPGWVQAFGAHPQFLNSLQNNADFVKAGAVIASYVGEFIGDINAVQGINGIQNVQTFTAADLQSMTIQDDPNSCYIGMFDGPDANSPGGVYLISAAWYAAHPGGTFAGQPWCGTPRFGWTDVNPSHQSFIPMLQNDADFVNAGQIIATYMGEFDDGGAEVWTLADLQARNINGDPDNCFIAIYDGASSSSTGGIYQITAEWQTAHPGGPLEPFCGGMSYNWLAVNPSHNTFATNLAENADIIASGNLVATYVGEFQSEGAGDVQGVGAQGSGHLSAHTSLMVSLAAVGSLYHVLGQL